MPWLARAGSEYVVHTFHMLGYYRSIANVPNCAVGYPLAEMIRKTSRAIERHYCVKQALETRRLAMKAANRDFPVKVLDSSWATRGCLNERSYKNLTSELVRIDVMTGANWFGIPPSLHWSRRYEYPYTIIKSIPAEPAKEFRVLDCGAQANPVQFFLSMRGFNVHSLDLDLVSLGKVAQLKSKNKLKTLYPTYGNVLDLPFPEAYFDRVLNISVLEHIIKLAGKDTNVVLKGFLNELLRILKPDGLAVLTFDVNIDQDDPDLRLYYNEYESLCGLLGILPTLPPDDRLCSSDTQEGRMMAQGLCTYAVTITHACN